MSNSKLQITKIEAAGIIIASLAAIATVILGFITFYQGKNIGEMRSKIEKLMPPTPQDKAQKIVCQMADNSSPELNSTTSDSIDNYLSLTLKQAIELAQQNNKGLRVANKSDKKQISEELTFRVVRDYYNLQRADAKVDIAEAMMEDATLNTRDAQLLEQAGLGNRFDVLRAEMDLANAKQSMNFSIANQRFARLQLAKTLNLRYPKEPRAADEIKEAGSWNLSRAESVALSYKNAEQTQRNININGTESDNPCSQIRLQVEESYNNLIASKENITISQKNVETATEQLRIARSRFQAGVGTQTDVINSQRELTDVRSRSLQAIIDYNQSLNYLQRAVGKP
ncbi:hypothetical protein myaer102_26720 [Microcystis viridis NIES-102]|uniref:Outer membrane efflux protein n=1 Tax=Microcystis viridis NIES-102 TaxID=213615 RepID=A0A3G9JHT3_MICVR|nr:TolC family protein [Microcystis viridis]BBH40123.1 hypothetical protein myaer102_26720 [Microcystis viridis NIES-102]